MNTLYVHGQGQLAIWTVMETFQRWGWPRKVSTLHLKFTVNCSVERARHSCVNCLIPAYAQALSCAPVGTSHLSPGSAGLQRQDPQALGMSLETFSSQCSWEAVTLMHTW